MTTPKIYKPNTTLRRKRKAPIKKATLFKNYLGLRLIKLKFPWSLIHLSEIKAIPGRKWHKENKYWTIPLTVDNCFAIKELHYVLGKKLKAWANEQHAIENIIEIPGLKKELFDYQNKGVQFLEKRNGRGMIADEMGLGKTVQALAWAQLHPEALPLIIVCPASLKLNWRKETLNWITNDNIQIIEGQRANQPITGSIIIINYDILPYWSVALLALRAKLIILDEIHFIKNNKANRTKACKRIAKTIPHVIGLSGTPIENAPIEIYNAVEIIDPTIFPNPWKFRHRYCDPKNNGFGWTFTGATNVPELHKILTEKVMIRRKKKDVLKDLPDKLYSFVPLAIDNRKEYEEAETDFIEYVKNSVEVELKSELNTFMEKYNIDSIDFGGSELNKIKEEKAAKANPLAQMTALKQICVRGKLKSCIRWIEDFLESGEKLVVFCEHIFVIDELMKRFTNIAVKIDGSVNLKQRHSNVESFQSNSRIKLFIGNKAAEVGLTLTAASNVAIIEYPWNPGKLAQRIDRVHRIGQKETVNVYYLMALNTIEVKIAEGLDRKQKMLDGVLDGKETKSTELMMDLINEYKWR